MIWSSLPVLTLEDTKILDCLLHQKGQSLQTGFGRIESSFWLVQTLCPAMSRTPRNLYSTLLLPLVFMPYTPIVDLVDGQHTIILETIVQVHLNIFLFNDCISFHH